MQAKSITLFNKGMRRDESVSKTDSTFAFENRNVRIVSDDFSTTLSVVNERGTKSAASSGEKITGRAVGWCVLNNYLIIFTHYSAEELDSIYRAEYSEDHDPDNDAGFLITKLYSGFLGFSDNTKIEALPYYESEELQKVYWVDGEHPLRFINIVASEDERQTWVNNNNPFDCTQQIYSSIGCTITKDNSGNTRPNGIVQYFLTYYNLHGQETGIVWASDIQYLSPAGYGGAADETNNNVVTLEFERLSDRFNHFRVYSVFTSSPGSSVAYIVADSDISKSSITVVDDAAHLTAIDINRLLYLGSQHVTPGTLAQKDNVLFLGNLKGINNNHNQIKRAVDTYFTKDASTGIETSGHISFEKSAFLSEDTTKIYNHNAQLSKSSSDILSFKGGEKYRFAITFVLDDGTETPAYWIGDKENTVYPEFRDNIVRRVMARCNIEQEFGEQLYNLGVRSAQLMIAEATYADRSVKAQGLVNPTVFNAWERYNNRVYSMPSWITRPRLSDIANRHFETVHRSDEPSGEIECNFWNEGKYHTPFYRKDVGGDVTEDFDSGADFKAALIVASVNIIGNRVSSSLTIWKGYGNLSDMQSYQIKGGEVPDWLKKTIEINDTTTLKVEVVDVGVSGNSFDNAKQLYHDKIVIELTRLGMIDTIPDESLTGAWLDAARPVLLGVRFFNTGQTTAYTQIDQAANGNTDVTHPVSVRWIEHSEISPAYEVKHLMFVDENVVTLDSPEITFNAVSVDNAEYKFRLVGISTYNGNQTDYTIDAYKGKYSGENIVSQNFSKKHNTKVSGLVSWPLFADYGLTPKSTITAGYPSPSDYNISNLAYYWLHMWQSVGSVTGYSRKDFSDADTDIEEGIGIKTKIFANLHFSDSTVYSYSAYPVNLEDGGIRQFTQSSQQLLQIKAGGTDKYYDGNVKLVLTMPGVLKYPKYYSDDKIDTDALFFPKHASLYSDAPVTISYSSNSHAVLSFSTRIDGDVYVEKVLPGIAYDASVPADYDVTYAEERVPWLGEDAVYFNQSGTAWDSENGLNNDGKAYSFIGEIYRDFSQNDTRYGGVSESAIKACRFIPAGKRYDIDGMEMSLIADRGDTYFQRWDCLRIMPFGEESVNNVIDITSFMLETHINIDGINNKQRGTDKLASIVSANYTNLNPVYSKDEDFIIKHDSTATDGADDYSDTVTWTLEKQPEEDIDSWTHITLANSLKLDGDKGPCNALRKFADSLYAFQDKGISEIQFNPRVQISASDGVPIELANSGKVNGKRYITDKYGCQNNLAIADAKSGVYFVDNYNKAFCRLNGSGVQDVSLAAGFRTWFNKNHSFVNKLFYDSTVDEIYLVDSRSGSDSFNTLAYSERMNAFSSFYDYYDMSFIVNIQNKAVSYYGNELYFHREGYYNWFYDDVRPFSVDFRIAPEPRADKIWSNIDYRAGVYETLTDNGELKADVNESALESYNGIYKASETFDTLSVNNDYQSAVVDTGMRNPVKRFSIWRYIIPRAVKSASNPFGIDRIRSPWMRFKLEKTPEASSKDIMQIHDITVQYFE